MLLRTALTALVLATAVGCGSSASSGPAVVAGAPAGDVAEVSGTVTATRDGKARPLVVGDVVSGDDVIETAADGRVRITLRHNSVAWNLGPSSREQVGASLAWREPKAVQTAAGPTGERSGAAGRHAEREAANTAASAEVAMAPAAAAPPAPPIAPSADLPAPGAAPTPPPPPPPVEEEKAAPRAAKASKEVAADVDVVGGLGLRGTGEGGGGAGDGIGLGSIGTLGHGSGTGEGRGYGSGGGRLGSARAAPSEKSLRVTTASGGLQKEIVLRIVRSKQANLYACHAGAGGRTLVRLVIGKDGKVTNAIASGGTAEVHTCVQGVLKPVSFPSAKSPTTAALVVETAP